MSEWRNHEEPCDHDSTASHNIFAEEPGDRKVVGWCDGGRPVTDAEIMEAARSLWYEDQATAMHDSGADR